MKRTILYYPNILIPTDRLKWALLYWDNISSIVPYGFDFDSVQSDRESVKSLKLLKSYGIYTAERPEDTFNCTMAKDFEKEFIENTNFLVSNRKVAGSACWVIYKSKISDNIFEFLKESNLVYNESDQSISVDSDIASLYMGMLAEFISRNST